MIQLPTVSVAAVDSPVDLMALLPTPTKSGSRAQASFRLDVKGADCFLASSSDAVLGADLEASNSYEAGPYDYPGASLWLHLGNGASCNVTPFRSGVMP